MTVGTPAQLKVATLGAGGAVATVTVVNQVLDEDTEGGTPIGGSYYSIPSNPQAVSSSASALNPGIPSAGSGATFNLTFGPMAPQRVVLCNQEQAILCYNAKITDPNLMDPLFRDAWQHILSAARVGLPTLWG